MIEDREKGGADPDNVGIGGDNSGVEKGLMYHFHYRRKNANKFWTRFVVM